MKNLGALCLAITLFALSATAGGAERMPELSFDIPAQPLKDALKAFGRQTGLSVAFYDETVAGRTTEAIAGRFTQGIGDGRSPLRDAFQRLNDAADPRRGGGRSADRPTVTFGPDDIPDLMRLYDLRSGASLV